jgi:hypothetical protein
MILAIGRYTALFGFTFAILLHLAGYVYVDLPHLAFEILTIGILTMVQLSIRGPFLDRYTPTDTSAKKIAVRLAAVGSVLCLLMTLIWIFVRGPEVGIGPQRFRFHTLPPVWRVSEQHYKMFNQQWQSSCAAFVYVLFWLQFSSKKARVSAINPEVSVSSSNATGSFPASVARLIVGTILTSGCLYLVGWVLHRVGLVEKGADIMEFLSLVGFILAFALAGIGAILGALRG